MLMLLSPAKKLGTEKISIKNQFSSPEFLPKIKKIIPELQLLKSADLKKMMKLSDSLAELNFNRFQEFQFPFTETNAKAAAFMFQGDTYTGLDIKSFSSTDLDYGQKHLRILSGLYGLLRPLDLIQPYRLEMGTKVSLQKNQNLYELWKQDITKFLNSELKKEKVLVNLASQEYFKAVSENELQGEVIGPQFKELRSGQYKIISFSAKKARGMMASFIIKNRIKTVEGIKDFNLEGYSFNQKLSTASKPVFTRES